MDELVMPTEVKLPMTFINELVGRLAKYPYEQTFDLIRAIEKHVLAQSTPAKPPEKPAKKV